MCLITAAPKGTKKRGKDLELFIKNGMDSNTHGSGFAYKRDGQSVVNIHKGFKHADELIEAIDKLKLKKEDELIIHHRIGTSGLQNEINMHPFAISQSDSVLQTVKGQLNVPVMAHNGVFYRFTDRNSDYNDTYHFVQKFVAIPEVTALLERDPNTFKQLFDGILSTNKFAFLFPKRDMVLIGDFKTEDGYYHSNGGYKRYVFDRGGSSANNHVTEEEMEDYYMEIYGPRNNNNNHGPNCSIKTAANLEISKDNNDVKLSSTLGRYIVANCYSLPIKHINLQKYNAFHFQLVVKDASISSNLSRYDVLQLTDYDPEAVMNWVTNVTNHNTMVCLNIEKCLRDGSLQLYVKKQLCEVYEGLHMLNEYICAKHNNIPPKSLMKNILKSVNICKAKHKTEASLIKFREFKLIHLCHLVKINELYNSVNSIKKDFVITNSEIVEETAS